MINQVRLAGALGGDAGVREFQNGDRMVTLRLACTDRWTDEKGEKRETTSWFSICVFGRARVERCRDLRKGQAVEIDGRLRTRKYQKDGRDVYVTEVVVDGPQHRCWPLDFGRRALTDDGAGDGAVPPEI